MKLRRGFASEANQIARDLRAELGLHLIDPLDAWMLADRLALPVVPMSELSPDAPWAVRQLSGAGGTEFSAVTVFAGVRRVIVHNDTHLPGRQASNITH